MIRRVLCALTILTAGASAQPGTLIKTVNLPVGGYGVSVGVDCNGFVYYTLDQNTNLFQMDANGSLLNVIPITDSATGGGLLMDEMAWDDTRQAFWIQEHNTNPIRVYLLDPTTGIATFQWISQTISIGTFRDGIAYDANDDTLWISGDVSSTIEHYQANGAFINQITPKNAQGGALGLISGVTVGFGDLLYLGQDGLSQIVQVKKSNGDFLSLFASPGGTRDEGLECDPVNFPGKLALWSREFYPPGNMAVIELEPETCACGGCPPGLTGSVTFEDGTTLLPDGQAQVALVHHPLHFITINTVPVQSDGTFSFPASNFSVGQYDLLLVVRVPSSFWHVPGTQNIIYQPYDLSPAPDIVVTTAGQPSPCTAAFTLAWPAVLLHGVAPGWFEFKAACPSQDSPLQPVNSSAFLGTTQLIPLQRYLASSRQIALNTPRTAILPLLFEMKGAGSTGNSLATFYAAFLQNMPTIINAYPNTSRFRLVGYSQGGLVARLAVNDPLFTARIASVINLGTPNNGTCVADNYCDTVPWSCQLTTDQMGTFNTTYPTGQGKAFFLLAGTQWAQYCDPFPVFKCCLDNTCLQASPNGSDGVVEVDSVEILTTMPGYQIADTIRIVTDHVSMPSNLCVMRKVHEWLGGNYIACP